MHSCLPTPPSPHHTLTLAEEPHPIQAEQKGGAQLPCCSALLLPLPLQDAHTIQTAVITASIVIAVTIQVPVISDIGGAVIIVVFVLTTGPFHMPQPDAGSLRRATRQTG